MSTITLLTIILFILMWIVGGKRGLASFSSVALNFILLFLTVIFISIGVPALWTTIFAGIAILVTIYMGNSDEKTTNIAFEATLISLAIVVVVMVPFIKLVGIQGFSPEQSEEIEAFNLLIGVNFESIVISTMILSTLGAIAEAAIAIASGLDEIIEQQPDITLPALYTSGRNIGLQIMGMTFNTLFFGMFGGDLALFILLYKLDATFGYYLNSKIFVAESIEVLFSSISIILVIWITTYMMGKKVKRT
ncbi:YibE/F family protein [Ligilactobacillus salivarius]|uniref:YibE/F family protein n=1 Tax=Ligilactobacillus salivarius TaxID=1624 RepID=UPI00236895BC|nr:YibE/F family protein [Ligilactobacillus salivarius]